MFIVAKLFLFSQTLKFQKNSCIRKTYDKIPSWGGFVVKFKDIIRRRSEDLLTQS